MEIKEFFEKAEKGGYSLEKLAKKLGIRQHYNILIGKKYVVLKFAGNRKQLCSFEKLLLDPEVWKAVDKIEKWGTTVWCSGECGDFIDNDGSEVECWKSYMHEMVEFLIEGKTIKQFIKML